MTSSGTIWYPATLRARWPEPLAREWRETFPDVFDDDDLRLAQSQPDRHFYEWLAAIHLLYRDGAFSLVEKYGYGNHRSKVETLDVLLGPRASFIREFKAREGVQPPDILAYLPDRSRYWFVEVKGPTDALTAAQVASHAVIERELGVIVEILRVKELRSASAR